jgi:hypothetical protein
MSETKKLQKDVSSTKSSHKNKKETNNLNEAEERSFEPIETDAMLEKCEENRLANAIINASKGETDNITSFIPQQQHQANGSSGGRNTAYVEV